MRYSPRLSDIAHTYTAYLRMSVLGSGNHFIYALPHGAEAEETY